MDPNASLEEMRSIISDDRRIQVTDLEPEQVARLIELFQSLDNWIKNGGCLPEQWQSEIGVPEEDSHWIAD